MLFARSDFLASHQEDLIRDLAGIKQKKKARSFLSPQFSEPPKMWDNAANNSQINSPNRPSRRTHVQIVVFPRSLALLRSGKECDPASRDSSTQRRKRSKIVVCCRCGVFVGVTPLSPLLLLSLSLSFLFVAHLRPGEGKKSSLNAPPPPPHLTAFWRRRTTAGWPLSPLPHPPRCLAVWPAPPNNAAPDRRRRSESGNEKRRLSPLLSSPVIAPETHSAFLVLLGRERMYRTAHSQMEV